MPHEGEATLSRARARRPAGASLNGAGDWIPRPPGKGKDSEAWFRSCPAPLLLLDPAGTILDRNSEAEALLGPHAIPGSSWFEIFPACASTLSAERLGKGETLRMGTNLPDDRGGKRKLLGAVRRIRFNRQWIWIAAIQDDAAWAEENRRLEERLRLETTITSLSTHFISLPSDRIDAGIQYALHTLADWAGADRGSLLQFADAATLVGTHAWQAKEAKPLPAPSTALDLGRLPWLQERVRGLHTLNLPNAAALPPDAEAERRALSKRDTVSLLAVPLIFQGEGRGYLFLETTREERRWFDPHVSTLRVSGELLINALERKKADLALQEAKQKYQSIFDNALEGMYQTTPEGRCLTCNPAAAAILGFTDVDAVLSDDINFAKLYVDSGRRPLFVKTLAEHGQVHGFESQIQRKDGALAWISESARAIYGPGGKISHYEGMVIDITQRKSMEERILHDALHDALTGLPNRVLFRERVDRALDRISRRPGECCAVLLLDLDRFKRVNESMGHSRGDFLLMELARRFEALLPPGTSMARLGGDEFAFLLEEIDGVGPAELLAERLLREMADPLNVDEQLIYASGSIGIALGTRAYQSPEYLLRDADTALDRAKGGGKGRHAVFDASMHAKAVQLLRLENDLRKALDQKEFLLHYQPIVDMRQKRLVGFEALVRWRPAGGRIVGPGDFIPVAEETGLILPLGKWVLEEACRQLREWQKAFPVDPPLHMSVNIASRQIEEGRLPEQVREICRATGLPPSSLKLEITESALIGSPDAAAEALRELREGGFSLSLDDFGTGYSSLSYLHRFPFSTLKIDRSFVAQLEAGTREDEIVRVISAMAGNLGMDVVAEGIESSEQMRHILRHGVVLGQGYYFARPLDAEKASRVLASPEKLWPDSLSAA